MNDGEKNGKSGCSIFVIILVVILIAGYVFGEKESGYTRFTGTARSWGVNSSSEQKYKDTSNSSYYDTGATMGESNALAAAKQYLAVMAFSYSGLIMQLEFEGYSNSEATYGANNCGADWYEQAALSAEEYLNVMAFSRQGLIDQLEYEGFSHDQAVYGVEQNGY